MYCGMALIHFNIVYEFLYINIFIHWNAPHIVCGNSGKAIDQATIKQWFKELEGKARDAASKPLQRRLVP